MNAPPVVVPLPPPPEPLGRLTFPLYVRALALMTAVAFVFALSRAPRAIRAGVDAERGRRDLASGRFAVAKDELGRAIQAFPEAKDERIDYAEACLKDGDVMELGQTLEWFEGKEVTKEQNERLESISSEGVTMLKQIEKLMGPAKGAKP